MSLTNVNKENWGNTLNCSQNIKLLLFFYMFTDETFLDL